MGVQDDRRTVHSGLIHPSHHQYWLGDQVEPNVDTLYDNNDPGADPLVAIDDSGRMACIHTGMYGFDLPVTVESWSRRPEPDLDLWEEVIEFSLRLGEGASVESMLSDGHLGLDLPGATGDYRIRLHAKGRREAAVLEHLSLDEGDEPVEMHMMQIWAEPSTPVRWLKELPRSVEELDPSLPRTDFYVETSTGRYWLSDYTTGRHAAAVTGKGNGVILSEPPGHMAAIFTARDDAIIEVVLDIRGKEPELDLDGWDEVAEVSMVLTGPDVGCNFGEVDSSPPGYVDLPAEEGQSRTYRVRVSVKGRRRPHRLADHPGDQRYAERHLIQIWAASEGPEKTWRN
ncbi:hypothetical protein BZB76_2223 [Actinomadura pelletieri DSM 43383]|uniref:Uncharacterized protein n=1 Tax=Actinomadura pelletieri DSM 43383 TaxID=1120940 RepID=A0A495QTU6_9ACTN|nr:hypothetical protein [Actinomadura pelletieri]RKS76857.1 hypothetical protein BZB76_2223 [Actinomadura pelletieri DSM 43383]